MGELKNEKKHFKKKIAAIILMLCLLVTLLPVEYYGIAALDDGSESGSQWEVLSFSTLAEEVSTQTVAMGTPLEALNLPNTLTAVCRQIKQEENVPETETQNTETETTEKPDTETEVPDTTVPSETPDTETEVPDTTEPSEIPDTETESQEPSDTESETPEIPDTETPDTEVPDIPDTETPETPETDTQPKVPDSEENLVQPEQAQPAEEEDSSLEETSTVKPVEAEETTTVTIKEHYASPETNVYHQLALNDPNVAPQQTAVETVTIEGVGWISSPEYNAAEEGTYLFTPVLPVGYSLAAGAQLPTITVTVEENGVVALDEAIHIEELPTGTPECGTISENTVWEAGTLTSGELIVNAGVTLVINGVLTIEGKVVISGGGTILRGNAEANFVVNNGFSADLTLKNITIEGGNIPSEKSMIEANRGYITLSSGSRICNCVKSNGSGAALSAVNANVVFSDAVIENCSSAEKGGAVYLTSGRMNISSGTYSGNRTTGESAVGGGFLYNSTAELNIYGGSFLNNTSSGRGGCIYHDGTGSTKTKLYGGYFQGNTSSYAGSEGSGAVWNSAVSSGSSMLSLSGTVQFAGDGSGTSGTDGIYLDRQGDAPRKMRISSTLSYPVKVFLEAQEGTVIAEGENGCILSERDTKKITFIDTGASEATWHALLDTDNNQIIITEEDPEYDYYVYYISNGGQGTVKDDEPHKSGDTVTIKEAEGLKCPGLIFIGWNTQADGMGEFYDGGDEYTLTEDLDLYAIFKRNLSGTFYSGSANQSVTIDGARTKRVITTPALDEMEGYTPLGWSTNPEGYTAEYPEGTKVPLTEPVAFYGIYKRDVTISYDTQTEGDVLASQTESLFANVHETISYQRPSFTLNSSANRIGYKLGGWNTKADGTGTSYLAGSSLHFGRSTQLYAEWIPNKDTKYTVEYYMQNIAGDAYEKDEDATQEYTAVTGAEVSVKPKNIAGFVENKEHPSRMAAGTVAADGSLVLKFFYDRNIYGIQFNLNGGEGTAPEKQNVCYGGMLAEVKVPMRTGYQFKGWYQDAAGTEGKRWDFEQTVDHNTKSASVTLYAKWVDETAPVLGEAAFNEGYKNFLNQIIRKKSLIINVPVIEEGSGIKQADYTLAEDSGSTREKSTLVSGKAEIETKDGQTMAKVVIDKDFSGTVSLTCTDNAGNISPEKAVTAADGKIIVEDNAPEIRFSSVYGELLDWFYDSAPIDVIIEDEETKDRGNLVSGGLSGVVYQIDGGEEIAVTDNFTENRIVSCLFTVNLTGYDTHVLSVTATDNAGNTTTKQVTVEVRRQKRKYRMEHYLQEPEGEDYKISESDTEEKVDTIGTEVAIEPNTYTGFTENTSHPQRKASGEVLDKETLVLKLYYDRDTYEVNFDKNDGKKETIEKQTVRYGAYVKKPKEPVRKGYTFKGWYTDKEGKAKSQWNFEKTIEKNTSAKTVTLYAKWEDETAPVLGEASYQSGYRTLLNYIIRKSNLYVSIPIIEEGSGIKEADYILMPDDGDLVEGKAQVEINDGQAAAKILIQENYMGSIALTASDYAGNMSAEKIVTSLDGGVIVEDSAPEIRFSSKDGELSGQLTGPVTVNVNVNDKTGDSRVAGGLANITYQLDEKDKKDVSDEAFQKEIVESFDFAVHISEAGEHTLSVTAIDNAGNKNVQRKKIEIAEWRPEVALVQSSAVVRQNSKKASGNKKEPQTGDNSKVELYATIAMIAGFLYMLLFFVGDGKEKKKKK